MDRIRAIRHQCQVRKETQFRADEANAEGAPRRPVWFEASRRDTRNASVCIGSYPKFEAAGDKSRKLHGASPQFAEYARTAPRLRSYRDEFPQRRGRWDIDGAACIDTLQCFAAGGAR